MSSSKGFGESSSGAGIFVVDSKGWAWWIWTEWAVEGKIAWRGVEVEEGVSMFLL